MTKINYSSSMKKISNVNNSGVAPVTGKVVCQPKIGKPVNKMTVPEIIKQYVKK